MLKSMRNCVHVLLLDRRTDKANDNFKKINCMKKFITLMILSDSRSTWKIQIVSKSMQIASNVSMRGGADRCTVKLQGTACVRTLTYPMFHQWDIRQVLLILPRIGRIRSWEERDQKVCCFPWAYALAAR